MYLLLPKLSAIITYDQGLGDGDDEWYFFPILDGFALIRRYTILSFFCSKKATLNWFELILFFFLF